MLLASSYSNMSTSRGNPNDSEAKRPCSSFRARRT